MTTYEELYDKRKAIDYLVQRLTSQLDEVRSSYNSSNRDSADAPGAMQSQHDTSGKEAAWLSAGYAKQIKGLETKLSALQNLEIPEVPSDIIETGSVINVTDVKTFDDYVYVVLPGGAGNIFTYKNAEMHMISPDSPISKALYGGKQGETVEIKLPTETKKCLINMIT